MKRETLRHPKTFALMSALGITRDRALGILTLLWDYVGMVAPQGDIGKWSNGVIAHACDWTDDADEFVAALVQSGWLDADDENRLVIHDWPDHCERWVAKKLQRGKLDFLTVYGQCPDAGHENGESVRPSAALSNPIQSNPNQTVELTSTEPSRSDHVNIPNDKASPFWTEVCGIAQRVGECVKAKSVDDRDMVLKCAALAVSGAISEDELFDAVEAVRKKKPRKPPAYFQACLNEKLGGDDALNRCLAKVTVPAQLVRPPPKEESDGKTKTQGSH